MATVTEDQNDNKILHSLSNSQDQNRQQDQNSLNYQIKLKRFNAVRSTLFAIHNNEQNQKHAQNRNENRNAHTVPMHQNNSQNSTHVHRQQHEQQPQAQPQQQQTQNTHNIQQGDDNDDDDTIMIKSQIKQEDPSVNDIELDERSTAFLADGTDKSESESQSGTSSVHTSVEAKLEESDQDVGYRISDAQPIKYLHWVQDKWLDILSKHKILFMLQSERIKDPRATFAYIMHLRAIYEHPKYRNLVIDAINDDPELVELRCSQIFSGTEYALYRITEDEGELKLIYPTDDDLYYTGVAMDINLPKLNNIVATRVQLLGDRVGNPNEANDFFDDYRPPEAIDITDDNTNYNQNQNTQDSIEINMDARAHQNQSSKIQNKDQQTHASQNIGSRKLNKDRNARAQQTGSENDLLRTSSLSTKPRIGNIGVSPTNIRRDNERSNVRNDVRPRIDQLRKEIARLEEIERNRRNNNGNNSNNNTNNIPQGTNNTQNTGVSGNRFTRRVTFEEDRKYDTDNERRERLSVAADELQKLISKEMFKEATVLNFKYDGSDKTPGNSLHFINQLRLWYKRCVSVVFENKDINDVSIQLLLCQSLTRVLSHSTRIQFNKQPLQVETVDNWIKRFYEITSIDEDFKNHFNLLKNFKPPKGTKIEKYIPAFKDAKAVHDMILPHVEETGKISNMQHYKFKDDEAIYEAAVSNMNQQIITEVRKYLLDNFNSNTIDWSYLEKNMPGYRPDRIQNINNINVLHTGILNLAKYTRDIRTNDKAGTKHINDSILEYPILEPKKKYDNDNATNIGNAVNALDQRPRGGNYNSNKFRGGYRRNYTPRGRSQGYKRQRDRQRKDFRRNYDNNNNYQNQNKKKNMPGFTAKIIKVGNWRGKVYNIKPNSQASDHYGNKDISYFSRKNQECRICPQSDNKRLGHSTAWHFYLKNFRSGAIQKLSNMYFSSKKKRNKQYNNQTNAIDDRRRLSNLSQNGRGRSRNKNKNKNKDKNKNKNKNKDKRGKTNEVGALAMQDDGTDRGGIIATGNNTLGNTSNQAFKETIENTREHNSNMLAAFQAVVNDNRTMKKAKASNGGTLLSFTTQSRGNETDPNL